MCHQPNAGRTAQGYSASGYGVLNYPFGLSHMNKK